MKILFLCGLFQQENAQEVIDASKVGVDFAANIFQQKILSGFRERGDSVTVISAPFIGSYPNRSTKPFFGGFSKETTNIRYVNFCNVWGIRNLSRAKSLKKACEDFLSEDDPQKLVVVYSAHTPFLETAYYIKKRDSRAKICVVIPDLPQYMNLSSKIGFLYRKAKAYDIKKINHYLRFVDLYVLLTEWMREKLPMNNKKYFVVEGIVEKNELTLTPYHLDDGLKYIVYTGTLNERYGIKILVDSFMKNDRSDYRLVICGRGDSEDYIFAQAKKDSRILFLGQVTPEQAKMWMRKADVLVNPRQNNEEYTKYSFPSKTIEYLLSGNPLVCYKLDGIPEIYSDFVHFADSNNDLMVTIEAAIGSKKSEAFFRYADNNLKNNIVVEKIVDKIFGDGSEEGGA